MKILQTKAVTADMLKDKVIAKQLMKVQEEYPDDEDLTTKLKQEKNQLKKIWS